MRRRAFLSGSIALPAATLGLLGSTATGKAAAAPWPKAAFTATEVNAAIESLFGTAELIESSDVNLIAPEQAENGAVVPIRVETTLPGTTMAIFAEKNPIPLITAIHLKSGAKPYYRVSIKMAETANVFALVSAGEKVYFAKKLIKVTRGGCGG